MAEKILTYRSAVEGERKTVTVVFCDVAGSTDLAERLGAERMHALLDRFFELAIAEVHRYEGTINQFLGDGFMALFGAPIAHEDHARRALLAAVAIRRVLGDPIVLPTGERIDISLHVGLNTGLVVVGKIGDDLRMDYTAVGDTTNVAARLQQSAAPGDILISAATKRQGLDAVTVEPLGDLSLKGRSEPIGAFRVLGLAARRPFDDVLAHRPRSHFVGREQEITALDDALTQVERGRGHIVGLVGEPGMGKSRLLQEFRQRLDPDRVTYLEGRCPPYGSAVPYVLVLDLLRANCDLVDSDTPEATAEKIRAALRQVGMDDARDTPYLLHTLGLKSDADLPAQASPETVKARTFEIFRQMALQGSRRRPIVFGLEDLHWIDPTSAEFVAALSEHLAGARILIIATYRPGYAPPWIGKSYATQLALRPLSTGHGSTIVDPLLPADFKQLTALIVSKAEGNPFFLEELARNVAEHSGDVASAVPETIHDVINARIDRLPEFAKRVLQTASVLGREFSATLLKEIHDDPASLETALRELVRSEFLYEAPSLEQSTYVFRHALTQEVAYGTLLERRLRQHHAAAGAAIARGSADPLAVAEMLAHHYGLSDRDDEAVHYALLAAEKAQRRWANEEALGYFEAALRRLDAMPDTKAHQLLRIDAVVGQAEVRFALGRHAEHVQALEAIRPLVEQSDDDRRRAAWYCWTGFLRSFTGGRPDVSIALCREAAAIAGRAELDDISAYAHCCLAHVSVLGGDLLGALAAGERALPAFEAQSNIYWACRTLWGMSMAANALGQWSRGMEICKRALDHGKSVGDVRLMVVGWWRTGSTLILQGRASEGIECCDQALSLSPAPYDAAMVAVVRAYGRIRSGIDLGQGLDELRQATAWFDRSKLPYTWTHFTLWLAEGLLRAGRAQEARELLGRPLAITEELGYRHLEGVAHRLLANSLLQDDPDAARAHLHKAMPLLEAVRADNDLAKAYVLQARLDPSHERPLLTKALSLFQSLGTLDDSAATRAALQSCSL